MELSSVLYRRKISKGYSFNRMGLELLKRDRLKEKSGLIGDVIFYGGIGILFVSGNIGVAGIFKLGLCMGTSKSVKFLCNKGIL
jgi:hypothetical protein